MNNVTELIELATKNGLDTSVLEAIGFDNVEGFPNYQRHNISGLYRNKNTHRVLKPNAKGQVRLIANNAEGKKVKWVMQAKAS